MAERGIVAVGEKAKSIRAQLADLTFDDKEIVYDSGGWNGGSFFNGNGRSYVPASELAGRAVFTPPVDRYRAAGTLEGWFSEVAEPLAGQMIAEFCFGLMFAGTLVAHAGQTLNPGFALVGPAEDGKSALLTIAASICGAPRSSNEGDGYPLSFASTMNGIEWEMQNYADMTMIIDEAALFGFGKSEKERGRALIELAMNLAAGKEKQRFKTLARHFNFCHVTSSNDQLTSILAGSASQSIIDAVASRFSSISLEGRPNGVLDELPNGYTDIGDFLGPLLAAADQHHGVAMPHYLTGLVDLVARNPKEFKTRLLDHMATFREAATLAQPQRASRRILDSFGLVCAASRLARHLGAIPASFSPLQSTLAAYRLHLRTYAPPRPIEVLAALLKDPAVREVNRGTPLKLTSNEFRQTKAFKVQCPRYTELLMTLSTAEALFEDWNRVRKHDKDIKPLLKGEDGRYDTYRTVRAGRRDRLVCFRVRPNSPLWNR